MRFDGLIKLRRKSAFLMVQRNSLRFAGMSPLPFPQYTKHNLTSIVFRRKTPDILLPDYFNDWDICPSSFGLLKHHRSEFVAHEKADIALNPLHLHTANNYCQIPALKDNDPVNAGARSLSSSINTHLACQSNSRRACCHDPHSS